MKVTANPLLYFGNTFQDVFAHLGVGTDKIRKLTQFIGINIGSGHASSTRSSHPFLPFDRLAWLHFGSVSIDVRLTPFVPVPN
jgi:hypothetical protein